jgi:hemerythrin
MPLELPKELEIGITKIDNQHKELVNMINQMAALGEQAFSKDVMEQTLDILGEYVVQHFNDEETLQTQCNYPKYSEHKLQHDDFVREFLRLKSDFNDEEGDINQFTIDLIKVVTT